MLFPGCKEVCQSVEDRAYNTIVAQLLQEMLVKLSDFVNETEGIEEIDMNPVFAYKNGAVVVDARIILS